MANYAPISGTFNSGGIVIGQPITTTDPLEEIRAHMKYLEDVIIDLEGRIDELEESVDSYQEKELKRLKKQRDYYDRQIQELEAHINGTAEPEWTISINVTEIYFCKAPDKDTALEMYENGECGAPERHIFDSPIVEEL